jgi:hypothetical protein
MGDLLEIKKGPLFDEKLRGKLEKSITAHTNEPEVTVGKIEDVICSHIVLSVRDLGEKLIKHLFNKITKS